MPYRLVHDVPGLNLMAGSVLALLAAVADSVSDAPAVSWESLGLKTGMALVIVFLVRELAKQRKDCAEEAAKREERMLKVVTDNTEAKDRNTAAMQELKASTDLQTSYYKTVAQTLLSREIHPKLPKEEP